MSLTKFQIIKGVLDAYFPAGEMLVVDEEDTTLISQAIEDALSKQGGCSGCCNENQN